MKHVFSRRLPVLIFLYALLYMGSCQQAMPFPATSPVRPAGISGPGYQFQLAPAPLSEQNGYSRKELEHFLFCLSDGAFLYAHAIANRPEPGSRGLPFVQTELDARQKQVFLNQEVTKWFEPKVTVRFHSPPPTEIQRMTAAFFKSINSLFPSSRFHLLEGDGPANILIQMVPGPVSSNLLSMAGETSVLKDRLRIHLVSGDQGLRIEKFHTSALSQPRDSQFIKFSPEDLKFLQNNRMVKVAIRSHSSPNLMRKVLFHELLHAIGIPGHSPFRASELFPLLPLMDGNERGNPLLTPLASSLVEMLYRPEILPGMTLGEAGRVLAGLRRHRLTNSVDTRRFLNRYQIRLESKRENLLRQWREPFAARMALLVKLDKLKQREHHFMEEWRELFEDEGRDTRLIDIAAGARTFAIRRSILRYRVLRLHKQLPLEKSRRKKALIREEQVILKDLLAAGEASAAFETRVYSGDGFQPPGERPEEKQMRRVVRMLETIASNLLLLKDREEK